MREYAEGRDEDAQDKNWISEDSVKAAVCKTLQQELLNLLSNCTPLCNPAVLQGFALLPSPDNSFRFYSVHSLLSLLAQCLLS